MVEIFQVTAEYSNAVLVAILPYVADFAKRLELPVAQPITMVKVQRFGCSPRSDHIGGRLVLTNGHSFSFDRGRVMLYRSPRSYFSLQDPDRVPEFYGSVKITKSQALEIAHQSIRRLGYTDAMVYADKAPDVTDPPTSGHNVVPRYRVRWLKPATQDPGTSVDVEVDATTGQIQMISLLSTNTWRPDPKIAVRPPVVGTGPTTSYRGGRTMQPVSGAYSNAFLTAILPQLSDFVRKGGFSVRTPLTRDEVDLSRYICGLVDGDPMAVVYLDSGDRFNYSHGQVIAFYSKDAFRIPGDKEGEVKDFYGKVNLTTREAVSLVRQTLKKLGYSEAELGVNQPPQVAPPRNYGTNVFARYFVTWQDSNGMFRAAAEIDASNRKLKGVYINDRINTNIWRNPPRTMEAGEKRVDQE